jgi:pimeloyl-ACP methyl ester carboxylesterase
MKQRLVSSSLQRGKLVFAGAILAFAMLGSTQTAAAASTYGACTAVSLPVALTAGGAANQTVSGELCVPNTWATGTHQVDVTTPGATYTSAYYDWPSPTGYSYAERTLQAGRAILDYDRIGSGSSSHPLSTSVTIQSDAFVLHQIIQWLHNAQGYTQVATVGHSYGSVITLDEAGTYNDENRVVLTGMLHAPDPGYVALSVFLYPALPPGYLTTIPNSRSVFYSAPTTNADVVAYDNAHPDLISNTSLATSAVVNQAPAILNVSNKITAPVLIVDGEDDTFFCGSLEILNCADHAAVLSYESPYFTSAASLSYNSVPHTGHDLATSTSDDQSFAMINNWITTH